MSGSPRKKVALYYPWCYLKSGVEKVILETVLRSRHDYTIFTNYIDHEQTFPEFRSMKNLTVLRSLPVQRSFSAVLKGVWTIATQKINLSAYDALLVHSEGLGDFITLRNRSKPVLCFCHTPVRPIYDPVYRREYMSKYPRKRRALEVYSFFYRIINRGLWRRYRRVFANSAEVRDRILTGRLCVSDRVEVLNPGVDIEGITPVAIREKYFLYAGRIKWTKNVELAIRAFQEFQRGFSGGAEWKLIIAGGVDKASREYFASLKAMAGGGSSIEFRLDPTTGELGELYAHCYTLIYPPLNEDWGIVPIEAMAYARPVLAVNSGGPKETIKDGETGWLLPPEPAAFSARMTELASDPALAETMGRAARERSRLFSWSAFVQRLDDYIGKNC